MRGLPPEADREVALTIGNFDGVHLGHQAMLTRLVDAAEDLLLPPAVLTFDPHPREFFAGAAAPPRISTLRDRLERFAAHGVSRVHVARFNATLAALAPEVFIDDVLIRRIGTRWLLVGEDFRFGKGRAGDLSMLRRGHHPFSVESMRAVAIGGARVSSSAVRDALDRGDFDRAGILLGRPYAICGRVAHGRRLGRTLGFPTANLPLARMPPLAGIFAVRVHGVGPVPREGVASVGVRPTVVADGAPLVEVYIFDFDESIYGRRIAIEFVGKLRDEAHFDDLDALARQIGEDVRMARAHFAQRAIA